MPLYEYKCEKCEYLFEELQGKDENPTIPCKKCGANANRQMSSFAHTVAGGSSNDSIDMKIGREANNRWQKIHDNQSKRRADKPIQTLDVPRTKDGKFMPVMALGDRKEVETRKEYVGALQDHRKQRQEKGIPQFSEKGAF